MTYADQRAERLRAFVEANRLGRGSRPSYDPAAPQKITVEVQNLFEEASCQEMLLTEAIGLLTRGLQSIPPEFRDEAMLSLQTHGGGCDSATADLDVSYWRMETADEVRARVQKRERELTENAAREQAAERRQYEMLKAKYEGKK